MIIDAGRKAIGDLIIASGEFRYIDIGDGQDDSSSSQTLLDHSILGARKLIVPERIGNILIYTVDFTGSEISSNVISEMGIFDALTGGNMLSRVNFNSVGPLAADETISFTFRLEVA